MCVLVKMATLRPCKVNDRERLIERKGQWKYRLRSLRPQQLCFQPKSRSTETIIGLYATTATKPYIRGTSETIARILQPYDIRVAYKPITTLRRLLTNAKDKDKPEDRQGAVYKIKSCDCQASYIGETGRNLSTRLTEHEW